VDALAQQKRPGDDGELLAAAGAVDEFVGIGAGGGVGSLAVGSGGGWARSVRVLV
jgi:hypothetical protein